jgi:hypothetical protein
MNRILQFSAAGVIGLVGCMAGLVFWLGSIAVHLWAVWYAYETAGFLAAVVTLSLPVFAELYWLFPVASATGTWWNMYSAAILLVVLSMVITAIVGSLAQRSA